jgi:hypothetical protein
LFLELEFRSRDRIPGHLRESSAEESGTFSSYQRQKS